MKYTIFSDGGARGNPGPAGYGFVIMNKNNKVIFEGSKYIGKATNNQAEYQGAINALIKMFEIDNNAEDILVCLDSKLIVEQINGNYKIKNEGLKPLYWQLRDLISQFRINIKFTHVARIKNKEADRLVNEALDKKQGIRVKD